MEPIKHNNILLVQEENTIGDNLVRNLRSLGYEVSLESSGEEAVGLAADSLRFDLILIDVDQSLGMDGPQAAREILSRRPVPIIFLFDQPNQRTIEKVKDILHYGSLPRSADKILLKSAIEMALQLSETHARSRQNEQHLHAVFDHSSIGIEIYDTNGQLIDTNPACLELFGVSKLEDILGFRLFEDPNLSDEMKQTLRQGQSVHYEIPFDFDLVKAMNLYPTTRDGLIWLDIFITPIDKTPETQGGYLVQVKDITEQKLFAQALEHSENRFRALVELSTDAITLIDANGMVTYEGPMVERLTGYKPEERLGKNAANNVHPDDLPNIREILRRIAAQPGRIENAEFRSIKKDGSIWWTEGTAINLLDNPDVQAIVINYHDITERKRAEQALQIQYQLSLALGGSQDLDSAMQSVLDAVLQFENIDSGGIYLMDPSENLYRSTHRGLSSQSVDRIAHLAASDPPKWLFRADPSLYGQYADMLFSQDEVLSREGMRATVIVPVQHEGQVIAVLVVGSHVLDHIPARVRQSLGTISMQIGSLLARLRSDNALRESEARFRELADSITDIFFAMDGDLRYTFWNKASEQLTGITAQEALGKTLYELFPDEDGARAARIYLEVLQTQQPRSFVNQHRLHDVDYFFEINVYPSHGGISVLAQDITRRMQAEQEIKRLLADKELLLREVHHRIKNNMTTIASLLALQANILSEPGAAQALQDACSRVNSMMAIYDQLYRSGDYQRVDLQAYLQTLLRELHQTWRSPQQEIAASSDIENIEIPIRISMPLGMIINEWITNAYKYAFPQQRSGEIRVSARLQGGNLLEVCVSDNGIGLPAEIDVHNPESFGLNLVQILVQQIEGSLEVLRKEGTSYKLSIPIIDK